MNRTANGDANRGPWPTATLLLITYNQERFIGAAVAGALAQFVSYQFAFGVIAALCALTVRPFLRVVTTRTLAQTEAGL